MPSLPYEIKAGGITIRKQHASDDRILTDVTLPAGKSGTLSTRTDSDTGIATVSTGHGILDTDTVDVYWDGGRRYNVDVTAVTGTTIALNVGSGDNYPTQGTAVVVCKQVTFNRTIDGDNLKFVAIKYEIANEATGGYGCHVQLAAADDSVIASHDLASGAGVLYDKEMWDDLGITNPYTGAPITKGIASNGDGTNAATLKFEGIQDVT